MSREIRPQARLVDQDFKPLGQRVPAPLHERIEQLCEIAYAAGERQRPSKMEMLAALLLATPTDGQELRRLLQQYGEATVGDALPWSAADEGDVIELPSRGPGPRSGRRPQR
jgi:hypothetical protein